MSSFVFHSSTDSGKYQFCDTVAHIACDDLLCIAQIVHSDYFDYRCAFSTVLDSYCCVTGFMDTLFSDNVTGVHSTIACRGMNGLTCQYNHL